MYWSEWNRLSMDEKDDEIRDTFKLGKYSLVTGQDHDNYISSFVEDDPRQKDGGKKTRRRRRQNIKKTRKSKTKRGKKSRKTKTKRK